MPLMYTTELTGSPQTPFLMVLLSENSPMIHPSDFRPRPMPSENV